MSDLSYLSDRVSVKGDNNDICDSVNISSINTGDTGDHKSGDSNSDNKSTGSR